MRQLIFTLLFLLLCIASDNARNNLSDHAGSNQSVLWFMKKYSHDFAPFQTNFAFLPFSASSSVVTSEVIIEEGVSGGATWRKPPMARIA